VDKSKMLFPLLPFNDPDLAKTYVSFSNPNIESVLPVSIAA
jgi:hypothetical protein